MQSRTFLFKWTLSGELTDWCLLPAALHGSLEIKQNTLTAHIYLCLPMAHFAINASHWLYYYTSRIISISWGAHSTWENQIMRSNEVIFRLVSFTCMYHTGRKWYILFHNNTVDLINNDTQYNNISLGP